MYIPTLKATPIKRLPRRSTRIQKISSTTKIPYSGGFARAAVFLGTSTDAFHHTDRRLASAFAGGKIYDDTLQKFASWKELVQHPDPAIARRWIQSGINEFARLFQGYGDIEGVDVLEWIHRHDVPPGKKVTYPRYTVDYRPEKDEPWRTRITAGGNILEYYGDTTTHCASMETIKCHWNSVLSTPGAKYCTADISNMYLCSELPESQYVRFPISLIPQEIIDHYNLNEKTTDGYVYARIKRAWYGLRESGKIAHDDLVDHLKKFGYEKTENTLGLFRHKTRNITFTLVVDDFGISYTDESDVHHLINAIKERYPVKVKMDPDQYIGITLKWDYQKRELRCSMDGYVENALKEFEHCIPKQFCSSPSKYTTPTYGQRTQYASTDDSPHLSPTAINFVQKITGKFLFYSRAIDNTMLHALNDIAIATINGTEATLAATKHFLNYAACNPNAEILYRKSDMILQTHADAAYLVCPQARSRAGGYHFLGNIDRTQFNGPILILAKVIKNVMASAAEAEIGSLFMNAQDAVPLRNCLIDLGHPQPATPLTTDNSTARGIIRGTMKQRQSKAIDMRFNWIRDRVSQQQFEIYWEKGIQNLADYPTKHHAPRYHQRVRPIYLHIEGKSPTNMQGCHRILEHAHEPTRVTPVL